VNAFKGNIVFFVGKFVHSSASLQESCQSGIIWMVHVHALRQYWRWFAEHGRSPKTVKNWVVYVAEQFDSETFNRGWNFNGALAVASALTTASPDIKADMGIDFDCAVIQERYIQQTEYDNIRKDSVQFSSYLVGTGSVRFGVFENGVELLWQ